MPIKLNFDTSHTVEEPTIVLMTKGSKRYDAVVYSDLVVRDSMNNGSEISFNVSKRDCSQTLWNEISDFKVVWLREWNTLYEIYVDTKESTSITKFVSGKTLGECELSQVYLYDIEINTEDDILRDDYVQTKLYDPTNHEASLLHRITQKIPHYSIGHVDESIQSMIRSFTFDSITIQDALREISEEIKCIVVPVCSIDQDGKIARVINVYDLLSKCLDCGERGEFEYECSKCGSQNIHPGYGEDTDIIVSSDNLGDDITYRIDNGSVKNCFRLRGGDDLMTAAIISCNPNGSQYVWNITDKMKRDMSDELSEKINAYESDYLYYQREHKSNLSQNGVNEYNSLIAKYSAILHTELKPISSPIVGYPALMESYFNAIDMRALLNSELLPTIEIEDTNAEKQCFNLLSIEETGVSVVDIEKLSHATIDSYILSYAKVIVDGRFEVKITSSEYDAAYKTWSGIFKITNYSDDEDTFETRTIVCAINDDYENFVRQKIDRVISDYNEKKSFGIIGLFSLDVDAFKSELHKYCLSELQMVLDACQACLNIMIEQGIRNGNTTSDSIYGHLYKPYYDKLDSINSEMILRESEIAVLDSIIEEIASNKSSIQSALDFENYIGDELYMEFSAYRREQEYSNDNYISDGLTNAELFVNALEFVKAANEEIKKSSEEQHTITATLMNLLAIKEFEPIVDHFSVGNWMRFIVDGAVYKLRLIEYGLNFNNIQSLTVAFSDITERNDSLSYVEGVISSAANMATSFSYVSRQANKGADAQVSFGDLRSKGLDVTNTKIVSGSKNQNQIWDEHGMLFREADPYNGGFTPEQMRIINSTLAITDDNWETLKTVIGKLRYIDPNTKNLKEAYGINGEVIVGNLILGEELNIQSGDGNMGFNERDGFYVNNSNGGSFLIASDDDNLFDVKYKGVSLMHLDKLGRLYIAGQNIDVSGNVTIGGIISSIISLSSQLSTEVMRASGAELSLDVSKANKSDVIGYDEIISSSSLSDKIASASALKDLMSKRISTVTGDMNDILESGMFIGSGLANAPVTGYVSFLSIVNGDGGNIRHQICFVGGSNTIYRRNFDSGSWSSWASI